MSGNGFFFEELTQFQKDLLKTAGEIFPEETEKFLKKEANKLKSIAKKIAKQDVGTTINQKTSKKGTAKKINKNWQSATIRIGGTQKAETKKKKKERTKEDSYHSKFKTGKLYDYSGAKCVRAYNGARHAHLIEFGHMQIPNSEKAATTREGRRKQYETRKANKNTKYVHGRYVFKSAENQFKDIFPSDCDDFLKGVEIL